tara:strand:- start:426 stop:743 length:318 start_codon:yes stop_codon:yes gene_type:complete
MVDQDNLYSSFDELFKVYTSDARTVLRSLSDENATLEHETAGNVLHPIKKLRQKLTTDTNSREDAIVRLCDSLRLEEIFMRGSQFQREYYRQMDILIEDEEEWLD